MQVEIVTRDRVINLGEKSGWEIMIKTYKGFDYGFYLGSGTYPSDDYRSSNLDINGMSPEDYRKWLWRSGVAKICDNPKRYKFKNYQQIFQRSADGFKNLILQLVSELDNEGKLLLIVDEETDIPSANVLLNCLKYLYNNNYGVEEIPF